MYQKKGYKGGGGAVGKPSAVKIRELWVQEFLVREGQVRKDYFKARFSES